MKNIHLEDLSGDRGMNFRFPPPDVGMLTHYINANSTSLIVQLFVRNRTGHITIISLKEIPTSQDL
jgi:hypothetical protein